MHETEYTIYVIRHKITKRRFYVGQTSRKLNTRLREHRCLTHNSAVLEDFKSYGKDNMEIVAIDYASSLEESLQKEEFWTRFLSTKSILENKTYSTKDGYFFNNKIEEKYSSELSLIERSRNGESDYLYTINHTLFSRNDFWGKKSNRTGPMSSANKLAISRALKEKYQYEKHHMCGKHLSEETKKKLSKANKGKIISMEQRKKISAALTGIKRRNYSEEEKLLMRETSSRNKAVVCITTGKTYFSLSEASRDTGARVDHISSCCKGRRKSAGKLDDGTKLLWKF